MFLHRSHQKIVNGLKTPLIMNEQAMGDKRKSKVSFSKDTRNHIAATPAESKDFVTFAHL
jgi:hypothetical protein